MEGKETVRELEQVTITAEQFAGNAALISAAYTQALSRVNAALAGLRQQFQAVAAVGLNAFSGLLGSLRPAARQLSELMAGIFGIQIRTVSTKGAEKTAAALGKVTKSARAAAKAQKDLYSFDQITRVSARGGGGASGSGSGKKSGAGAVDGAVRSLLTIVEGGLLDRVWAPFRAGWEKEGGRVVAAARRALKGLGEALGAVGESWLNVWTNGSGEEAVSTVLQIVRELLNSVSGFAGQFTRAWDTWDKGERIFQNLSDAVQIILDHVNSMAAATAQWAAGLDLNGLVRGFLNVTEAIKPLTDLVGGALSWCYTNVLLPLGTWVIESAGPAALKLLAEAIRGVTGVLNALAPIGQTIWNNVLRPLGNWSCSLLTTGLELARQGFQNLSNVFSAIPAKWQALKESVSTLWQNFTSGLTTAASGCKTNLLNIFSGIGNGITQKLSNLKTALTTPFKNGLNAVIDLVNRVINKLNSALKFSWDPIKVMGKTVAPAGSVTLAQIPNIPKLAQGGLITGPTYSLIGEAGREAVLPLERNTGWMDALAEKLAGRMGNGGELVLEVHLGGEKLTRQVIRDVNQMTRRNGRCPIYV